MDILLAILFHPLTVEGHFLQFVYLNSPKLPVAERGESGLFFCLKVEPV